jgi:hypothetical protein
MHSLATLVIAVVATSVNAAPQASRSDTVAFLEALAEQLEAENQVHAVVINETPDGAVDSSDAESWNRRVAERMNVPRQTRGPERPGCPWAPPSATEGAVGVLLRTTVPRFVGDRASVVVSVSCRARSRRGLRGFSSDRRYTFARTAEGWMLVEKQLLRIT